MFGRDWRCLISRRRIRGPSQSIELLLLLRWCCWCRPTIVQFTVEDISSANRLVGRQQWMRWICRIDRRWIRLDRFQRLTPDTTILVVWQSSGGLRERLERKHSTRLGAAGRSSRRINWRRSWRLRQRIRHQSTGRRRHRHPVVRFQFDQITRHSRFHSLHCRMNWRRSTDATGRRWRSGRRRIMAADTGGQVSTSSSYSSRWAAAWQDLFSKKISTKRTTGDPCWGLRWDWKRRAEYWVITNWGSSILVGFMGAG